MTPEDAFANYLESAAGASEDDLHVLASEAGSSRELADELGVSQRTVQRWFKYESGTGEGRNWRRSPIAGAIRQRAQELRLELIPDEAEYDADSMDLEYETDGSDQGQRHPPTFPVDNTEWKERYAAGDLAGAAQAWQAAVLEGYGITGGGLAISNITGFREA